MVEMYVLIMLAVYHPRGVSSSVAEFTSKEKCEIAGEAISKQFQSNRRDAYYVCVRK